MRQTKCLIAILWSVKIASHVVSSITSYVSLIKKGLWKSKKVEHKQTYTSSCCLRLSVSMNDEICFYAVQTIAPSFRTGTVVAELPAQMRTVVLYMLMMDVCKCNAGRF